MDENPSKSPESPVDGDNRPDVRQRDRVLRKTLGVAIGLLALLPAVLSGVIIYAAFLRPGGIKIVAAGVAIFAGFMPLVAIHLLKSPSSNDRIPFDPLT